jgi:ATP-binding cassette subfamily F protein 3
MQRHTQLAARLEFLGGYRTEHLVEAVLSGIGLEERLWGREARTLSGGEKSRTALSRELIAGHDLLLLDEPTNHLDLEGIEWIENWLRGLPGAVLIVSHDRRLLNVAVDAIVELERGELRRYPGNYDKYVALRQERYTSEKRAWDQQQAFISKEEGFIRKHMGSQRTAEAKGRQRKLGNLVRLPEPYNDVRKPHIRPPKAARGGELVLEARELSAGYDGKALFQGVDVRVGRGQRIGIVGPNGSGKTTLLEVLAGRMTALAGEISRGHRSVCGYHDQEASGLDEDGTPLAELRRDHPTATDQELRDHLARLLFRGNEVEKPIQALSGGERARLCLAKLTMKQPSWLAMDEPTNHLDLAARTALEEMLGRFDGALVCVSHDRAFLDGLCTHIIEVSEGHVRAFVGNYSDWHAAKLQGAKQSATPRKAAPPPAKAKRNSAAGKVRNPYKFKQLEARIIALEEELSRLQTESATEEVYKSPERLKETQIRMAEVEDELGQANEEWENWE